MNEYPAVAGHQLRHIVSQRWGDLVHVGNTDMAYRTLGAAVAYAKEHPLTYDHLCAEYALFGIKHDITWLGSADEHLFDERLTDEQRLWLVEFCRRWDSIHEFEVEEELRHVGH